MKLIKQIKQRALPALLCAFALSFTWVVFGPVDIFVGNRVEFTFAALDFIGPLLGIGTGLLLIIAAVLLLLPDKIYKPVLGVLCGAALMSVLQSWFLNGGTSALPSGDMVDRIGLPLLIIDTVLWLAVPVFCGIAAARKKWADWAGTISTAVLVVVCGIAIVGMVSDVITLTGDKPEDSTGAEVTGGVRYLSADGMNEVAPESNIIVFILDRFDIQYHDEVLARDPSFFEPLTGFTYFSDNISYFTATYPSVTHIVSGAKQDFSKPANDFFNDAYSTSPFLHDLKDNDYAVRLYTGSYYAYRDATTGMDGIVDNARVTGSYVVTNKSALLRQMLVLSVYRYAPCAAKVLFPEAWFNFEVVTNVEDNGEGVYALEDIRFAETMAKGLTLQQSDRKNAYIFYHLNGCHTPLYMNENCERVEKTTVAQSTMGCFRIIYGYINELKRLGLYENATIVITGDHSQGFSDVEGAAPVNGTALFVKPAGKSAEPLTTSTAQVCDDNLFAALVKSAGIRTQNDYGTGYFDIPEGTDTDRYMVRFKTNSAGVTTCIHFTIRGPWVDKNNWTETERTEFTDFYK